MDPTAQLVRWSIPGGVFGLAIFGCWGIAELIFDKRSIGAITHAVAQDQSVAATVIAVFASVPLGFVLYQAYFIVFDEMRYFSRFIALPQDRGAIILSELDASQRRYVEAHCVANLQLDATEQARIHLTKLGLWRSSAGRRAVNSYRIARRENWRALQWLLADRFGSGQSPVFVARYQSLSDLYHALGAARTAVLAGPSVFLLTAFAIKHARIAANLPRAAATSTVIAVMTYFMCSVFHHARGHTSQNLSNSLVDMLRSNVPRRDIGEERRRFARRSFARPLPIAYLRPVEALAGRLIDASRGGLAFQSLDDRLKIGALLEPQSTVGRRSSTPTHRVVSIEVDGSGDGVVAHCAFVNPTTNLNWLSEIVARVERDSDA